MRTIDLQEYETSEPQTLSVAERDALLACKDLHLDVTPVADTDDRYTLTPGSTVGAVEVGGLSVRIAPKIGIRQLLSLACYAMGSVSFQDRDVDFPEEDALPDALAIAFGAAARRALSRGLLHGYRTEEEALAAVRGRIRFDDQLRRRFGIPLPVEVRYDDFTDDILLNRLVKAAAHRLGRLRLRSPKARRDVAWVAETLESVRLVEFPRGDIPEIRFDRLNEHYRSVAALARLILRHGAFEADRRDPDHVHVRAAGFLMDMNVVFQQFVTTALREALGLSEHEFGEHSIGWLDQEGRIKLKPDLAWREGERWRFVGDVKYKRLDADPRGGGAPNADLYQLLAYATATDLPGGLLIYAEDPDKREPESTTHRVRHAGKVLEVVALDLTGDLDDALQQIQRVARHVKALAQRVEKLAHRPATDRPRAA